jgi:pimeloyl-ACP methyl ester carboxylesterase
MSGQIAASRCVLTRAAAVITALTLVGCSGGSDAAPQTEPSNTPAASELPQPSPVPASNPAQSASQPAPTDCGFNPPGLVEGSDLRCFVVTAPLGDGPDGPLNGDAEIFVTVIGADEPAKADPIVHLPGGPGASSEAYAPVMASLYLDLATRTDRQVVFIDQRGTGRSKPFLTCDDPAAAADCVAAWADEGIDPLAISTTASADDVAAVAAALGAETVNLWGASYGSRLALEVTRRHPEIVRSLLVESVDTAATPLTKIDGVRGAFDRIDARCADDVTCSALGVTLATDVDAVATTLTATPLTTSFGALSPETFLSTTIALMEVNVGESLVPLFVAAVRDGDIGVVDAALGALAAQPSPGGPFSVGMRFVTNCGDIAPFDAPMTIAAIASAATSPLDIAIAAELDASIGSSCDNWPHRTDGPSEPVTSDVPTLVLNGADDSNTPLSNAELAAEGLSNSTLVALPGFGHFPLHRGDNPCAADIYVQFVGEPTSGTSGSLDLGCVSPGEFRTEIGVLDDPMLLDSLVEQAVPSAGFALSVPGGWLPLATGGAVSADGATLAVQLSPADQAATETSIIETYGIADDQPAVSETIDVGGAAWTFGGGASSALGSSTEVRYALTAAGSQTVVVLVAGAAASAVTPEALLRAIVPTLRPL